LISLIREGAPRYGRKEAIMEMSDYALLFLANERLDHAREAAARRALVASLTSRPAIRLWLGGALVALGQRLQREPAPQRVAS
jgi:hypothetical protein